MLGSETKGTPRLVKRDRPGPPTAPLEINQLHIEAARLIVEGWKYRRITKHLNLPGNALRDIKSGWRGRPEFVKLVSQMSETLLIEARHRLRGVAGKAATMLEEDLNSEDARVRHSASKEIRQWLDVGVGANRRGGVGVNIGVMSDSGGKVYVNWNGADDEKEDAASDVEYAVVEEDGRDIEDGSDEV